MRCAPVPFCEAFAGLCVTRYALRVNMYYKIAQLSLRAANKAKTIGEIFVAQPDAEKEALAGKLFILIEIESKNADSVKLINFLINELENNYYRNEKIILREKIKSLKVEHLFESALAKTNKSLFEFIRAERIKIDDDLINITAGIIHENDLHFANLGKNKALLIYKSADKNGEEKYKITDIAKQAKSDSGKKQINPAKLFSNVISGSIPARGYFLFTNEALPEYLSSGQLLRIITALPPAGAIEQIKNTLNKINAYVSFFGIIIKNAPEATPVKLMENIGSASSQSSIENLNATEDKTEKLLAASGAVNFKKWLKFLNTIFEKIKIAKPAGQGQKFLLKEKILIKRRAAAPLFKKIWEIAKNIFIFFFRFTVFIVKIITNKNNAINACRLCGRNTALTYQRIKQTIRGSCKKIAAWFKGLSKKNKILIIIALACLLILTQNLIILNLKNEKIEKEQVYSDLAQTIEKKQNQIDASLLYSNEESANKILEEISGLLEQIPRETEDQINKYNEYADKHKQQLEKTRRVVKIESPDEIADFVNLHSGANPDNIIILLNKNKIYAGDSGQKSIYMLDLKDNLITAIAEIGQNISLLDFPIADKNDNIYYLNSDNIIKINDKSGEISKLTVNFKGERGNIAGADTYNSNLYFLDSKNNQIYRHSISAGGIGGSYSWLAENADFSKAADISIDGHIYVLKSSGEVLKYLKGQADDFTLENVEPKIENARKIIVSPELKYIYMLEPVNKRLIIFDKTGKFLLQYHADEFNELKDFAVDEAAKKIYFLNAASVYEIEGTHFEE
ncbi:hypothetical protein L6267_03620 [Candidatus Parcubacteria bacterium]|nr:hypothetical protein [Candidatus Parcubacteria bacterium]